MIEVKGSGNFRRTEDFLRQAANRRIFSDLDHYGRRGVDALSSATPIDDGETAKSWGYKIERSRTGITIYWFNNHTNDGEQIAILIQYGHATGTGGYVVGRDYINPAIQPIFDEIADSIWKKVTR